MSNYGWKGEWGNSLLTVLFIMLFVCVFCFIYSFGRWNGKVKRWLFRVTWLMLLLHLIGCVVVLIVFNYRMGLFVMALALHILICIFRTNEASNSYGLFLMGTFFTLALLACCLLAHFNSSELYNYSIRDQVASWYTLGASDSSGSSSDANPDALPAFRPLICAATFANHKLSILSLALLAKIGYNTDVASQVSDLQQYFPDFERVGSLTSGGGLIHMTLFRQVTETQNTTFLAVRPGTNVQNSIILMNSWIDVYLFSFFGFLMPPSYVDAIMPYLSFALDMSPLTYKNFLNYTAVAIEDFLGENFPNEKFYVVGHGISGATGAMLVLREHAMESVLFASPPIVPSKFQIPDTTLETSLLNVVNQNSVYYSWYVRNQYTHTLFCHLGGTQCDTMTEMINTLTNTCDFH
ncbi:hypothetical protein AGDE_14269 [Angomonas deanei]|uniref:Fungal lipase-like domain-containing protein n=1 Tax=Angomonas deanei TaxID=59799 RepID=A0A7G2C5L1_9TRYP|nr:hypothetical protein AGDE_14269 [Angomonas deanei]CAD2214037.1 hypothetical protein, conserved [Angomonas deanei]|eukprot:EPY21125.1 hypothetical protein AGDE_14269 [Angomonas deanei]